MTISEQAIRAAAEALPGIPQNGQDVFLMRRTARAALEAAMPHIRAQIAEEIRNAAPLFSQATESGKTVRNTLAYAADIVEGEL